jgi:hypothetical protein
MREEDRVVSDFLLAIEEMGFELMVRDLCDVLFVRMKNAKKTKSVEECTRTAHWATRHYRSKLFVCSSGRDILCKTYHLERCSML